MTKQTGIEFIAQERKEQIEKHGRTVENDVKFNTFHQLTGAAIMLLDGYIHDDEENRVPFEWDGAIWDNMIHKPYKDRLVIAGALIAAEIDRLQAEEEAQQQEE